MSSQRQFVLGLLFVAALAILGYYTLFLTDFTLFKERWSSTVHFPEASGLRKGDAVLVAGMRQGKVRSLSFDANAPHERRVTAVLSMDHPLNLREGYRIQIAAATLLGGTMVAVEPGSGTANEIGDSALLLGTIAPNALQGISDLLSENREKFDAILANIETASADVQVLMAGVRAGEGLLGRVFSDPELETKVTDAIEGVESTFTNLSELSDGVLAGRGVIGQLFTDEDLVAVVQLLADNLGAITNELRTVTSTVSEGRGMIGRLIVEDEIYDSTSAALTSLRAVVDKINAGEGTLGRLVMDDEMGDQVAEITRRLADGEGTIGKLLTNEEVYDNIARAVADVAEVTTAMREGHGTLGKLLTDETLYEDIERAIATVNRSLEEFREVAPITAFSAVLFGVF